MGYHEEVFIPEGTTELLELADLHPSSTPLAEMIVHLTTTHLQIPPFRQILSNSVQVHIFEALVNLYTLTNQFGERLSTKLDMALVQFSQP
jgi:hypothetical protein